MHLTLVVKLMQIAATQVDLSSNFPVVRTVADASMTKNQLK